MKKMILSWLLIGSSCMVFAQNETGDTTRTQTNTYDSTKVNNTTTPNNNMNGDSLKNTSTEANSSMSSQNQYNAYGASSVAIPYRAQMNLQKDYPTASNIAWTKSGDFYHGTYMNNGRYSHIYYDDRGNTYTVSMPVTQTYVPDDIVTKATSMFGPTVYDVTTLKKDSTHYIYQIRTLDNGQVKAQWIGDDGAAVMDPFRSDVSTETSTSTNAAMNGTDSTSTNVNTNVNTNVKTTDSTSAVTTDSTKTSSEMNNSSEKSDMKMKTKTSEGEIKTKSKSGEAKKEY